jgi:CheY-like chemotaxis protein
MSHEIRTPMNAVVAYLELLMATKVTATQQRYLDNIKVSAQILISTLNDILDLNKLDFGTVELEVIPFKLDIIVENILSQFRNKCAKKGVELKLEIEDNVPQKLRGDPLRIQQILTNLVDNAIKFTNKGQVGLKIDVLNNGENHILLAFSVSDTGIGMTPEQVEIIFDPFAQADATISRKYGGTGLGLAICKKLVELYSGDLWVESESGIGSIFHFTAMFDNFEKPLTEKSPKVKAVLKKPNKTSVNKLKDAHILLVEDNEINQRIMIELLQGAGMAVTVANDGYEAIRAINEVQYDMVLMDIRMPIMDGYEATRQIRQNPKNQSLPIIALTASTRFNDCSNYLDCGFNDYVFKPVGSAQLFSIMARWIKKKQKPMAHGTRPIVLPDEMLTIGQAEDTDEIMNLLEGIDWHRAVTNLAGKMDLFIDLLSTFNHKHQTIIREIRDAIAKGDMTLAERLAHTLKGTAGYLAADEVYQAADEIENVIRLNKYDNLGSLVNKLEKLVKRTCSSIATFEKFSELLVKGESNA